MRSLPQMLRRTLALAATLLGAAALAGPACSLISQGDDCKTACNTLTMCGQLHTSDCGLYCTAMVYSVGLAGCSSEFDAQNACAKSNADCSSAAGACSTQTAAFTKCMNDYCGDNPNGDGCPDFTDGGTTDGGTGDGG